MLSDRELLEQLAVERFKAAGTPPNAAYMHGPTGMLSPLGLGPTLFSAMVTPKGLSATLPVFLSNETNPVYAILTGMTASTGTEPAAACGDFPQAGDLKTCAQTWTYGRLGRESTILQVDKIGQRINRGEFMDQRILNDPFAPIENVTMADRSQILKNECAAKLWNLNLAMARDYARLVYTGNPANTAGDEGYIEYNGLDILINTGYQDTYTGVACPAADSIVNTFSSVNVATDPGATVRTITELLNALRYRAEQLFLDVEFKMVGRYSLFRALSRIWPCGYLTDGCTVPNGSANNIDAMQAMALRDSMRTDHYLLIEGIKVPFIIDDSIAQTGASPTHDSTLYIVPTGIVSGEPVLFWDFFNMQYAAECGNMMAPNGSFSVTAGGRYLLEKKAATNECIAARILAKPRLILRTPFLAARLTDVRYTTYQEERSPFPGDANFVNGGNTSYPAPTFLPLQ